MIASISLVQHVAIFRTRAAGGEPRVGRQLRHAQSLAATVVDVVAGGGDVDVAVGGREHAGRNAGRMVVAGLSRHLMRDCPARRLEVQHRDLRAQQGTGDPLALARLLSFQKRNQNAHRGENTGGQIGDGDAHPHRPLAGQSGDRHQPAHALRDLIEPRTIAVRPVLAETRDAGIDDAFVDFLQRLIIDAEAEFHVRTVILHHDVGLFRQAGCRISNPSGAFKFSVRLRLLRCRF